MTGPSPVIRQGSQVTFHFRLSLPEGFVVEDTFGDEPVHLEVGSGDLVDGLEASLLGRSSGESGTVELLAEQAFGLRDDERIMQMDKKDFPTELAIETGKIIGFTSPSGEEVAGLVLEIGENAVTIDFNHPLAGKRVVFDFEVISVE